jgi:hypothetical protein
VLVLATVGLVSGAPEPTKPSAFPAAQSPPPAGAPASVPYADNSDGFDILNWILKIFGAPEPTTPSASPTQSPPTGSTAPATRRDDSDGFQMTNRYFQTCVNMAAEIESVLQKLHAESVTGAPDDKAKQGTNFLKMLTERYPGATFDGRVGTVPFQENFVAYFNSALNVDNIKDVGPMTLDYQVKQGRIHISEGMNSVTILIDQTDPTRSSYINVTIPAIKEEAEQILADHDRKEMATDTAETAILNDAYQLLSQTNKMRMDIFATYVIVDPGMQEEALKCASSGYRVRHPVDDQRRYPAQTTKKKSDAAPNKPTPARFFEIVLTLFLIIVPVAGVLWAMLVGTRALNARSMDIVQIKRQSQYNSLSPMVMRVLRKLGASLWGRNLPWSRNYYVYQRNDCWLLCDGKEDKDNKIFRARTKVEVSLKGTCFKIIITRLTGFRVNISLDCNGWSEEELQKGLKEISLTLTKASDRNYGADDEAETENESDARSEAPPTHQGTAYRPTPPVPESVH